MTQTTPADEIRAAAAKLRARAADAAMAVWSKQATLCEHTQQIPIGVLVDAVLAVSHGELTAALQRAEQAEEECAAVRQQLTAARMARTGAEREAETARARCFLLDHEGRLAHAEAAISRAWDLVDDMRAESPQASSWADRLSVALSEQTGDPDD